MSLRSQVKAEKEKIGEQKAEWDRTTVASETKKQSVEDKVASKIANDLLRDN